MICLFTDPVVLRGGARSWKAPGPTRPPRRDPPVREQRRPRWLQLQVGSYLNNDHFSTSLLVRIEFKYNYCVFLVFV